VESRLFTEAVIVLAVIPTKVRNAAAASARSSAA